MRFYQRWRTVIMSLGIVAILVGAVVGFWYTIQILADRPVVSRVSLSPTASISTAVAVHLSPDSSPLVTVSSPTLEASSMSNQSQTAHTPTGTAASRTQCASIDKLIANLERTLPTWTQLDCHMATLQRLSIPTFATHISADYFVLGNQHTDLVASYRQLWQTYQCQAPRLANTFSLSSVTAAA